MVGNVVIKFMPKSIMLTMHQNKINFHEKFDHIHFIQNNIEKGKDFKKMLGFSIQSFHVLYSFRINAKNRKSEMWKMVELQFMHQ